MFQRHSIGEASLLLAHFIGFSTTEEIVPSLLMAWKAGDTLLVRRRKACARGERQDCFAGPRRLLRADMLAQQPTQARFVGRARVEGKRKGTQAAQARCLDSENANACDAWMVANRP